MTSLEEFKERIELTAYEYEDRESLSDKIKFMSCSLCKKEDAFEGGWQQGQRHFKSHFCTEIEREINIVITTRAKHDAGGIKISNTEIQCGRCKKIYDVTKGGYNSCLVIHGDDRICVNCCGYIGDWVVKDE